MSTTELARIQQMSRDQVVVELQNVMAALDNEPTDGDLDSFDEIKARLAELDDADAAEEAQAQRVQAAMQDFQHMKQATYTATAVRPAGDDLVKAFDNFVRTGKPNADIAELRDIAPGGFRAAQSEGTGSEGGYLVPSEMRDRMVDRLVAFGGVMQAAEILTTSDGRTIEWPDLDDTDATDAEQVAEGGSASGGGDLVFTKHQLGAYRFDSVGDGGNPLRVSRELLEDEMFNILGMIERKLPQRIMRHVADKFINGTGANEPEGLLYGVTGVEPVADTTMPTHADIIEWEHSVDPAYRLMGNCSWVMNDSSWATIKKVVDSNGDPLWTNANGGVPLDSGVPAFRLMGYPVVIDQACDDISVADNTVNWGAFGDIYEGFVIRMVGSPSLLVDPYTRIGNNEIQYVANQRMDSIKNNDAAYIAMTGEQ